MRLGNKNITMAAAAATTTEKISKKKNLKFKKSHGNAK